MAVRLSHWSKSLVVSPESVQEFSHHFLTIGVGLGQKMDITLGHDCQIVNCKTKNLSLLDLIVSKRKCTFIGYEIMNVNVISNATKLKVIILLRDKIF